MSCEVIKLRNVWSGSLLKRDTVLFYLFLEEMFSYPTVRCINSILFSYVNDMYASLMSSNKYLIVLKVL